MRLIGEFSTERLAYSFHNYLLQEGIKNVYELSSEVNQQSKRFRVWIIDEDDLEKARNYYSDFIKNPEDSRFFVFRPLVSEEEKMEEGLPQDGEIMAPKIPIKRKKKLPFITYILFALCTFIYFLNQGQEVKVLEEKGAAALQIGLTPIQRDLLFEYPEAIQKEADFIEKYSVKSVKDIEKLAPAAQEEYKQIQLVPYWMGFSNYLENKQELSPDYLQEVKLFTDIRNKEVWRLITPIFLHRDFLHILFNLLWLWILSKQVEERIKKLKFIFLVLIISVVSNVAQYLVSGPFFVGISGVVVGLAAFIWLRQKKAPWEGYRLSKPTALFLFIYVMSMVGLEVFSFASKMIANAQISDGIANTAHVIGGLVGLFLAKLPFFARKTI